MKFKICLLGCGGHSRSAHGPSLQKYARQDADVLLGGACDLHLPAARAYAADFGFARAYADWRTMLAAEKPDAVSVVLPTHLTARACIPMLESGLPLLIEKPAAMTCAEHALLSAAAERGRALTSVAFNRRHTALMRRARALLQQNVAPEDVFQIDYDMVRHNRRDADFSTTAIHALDALLYLARGPLRQASFRYREVGTDGVEVKNILMDGVCAAGADVRLSLQPVAGVVLERACVHARGHTLLLEFSLRGPRQEGSLRYWRGEKLEFETTDGNPGQPPQAAFEQNGFYTENKEFFDAVRGRGGPPEVRVQDCGPQITLMEAIRNRAPAVVLDISASLSSAAG